METTTFEKACAHWLLTNALAAMGTAIFLWSGSSSSITIYIAWQAMFLCAPIAAGSFLLLPLALFFHRTMKMPAQQHFFAVILNAAGLYTFLCVALAAFIALLFATTFISGALVATVRLFQQGAWVYPVAAALAAGVIYRNEPDRPPGVGRASGNGAA